MANKPSPFDYLNSINNKVDHPDLEHYSPFMANRGLSWFIDTVMLANEMNIHHSLDKDIQFKFLFDTVRKKRRFSKWDKYKSADGIDAIKEYYNYSEDKAREVLSLLSIDQINTLKNKVAKGGMKKKAN